MSFKLNDKNDLKRKITTCYNRKLRLNNNVRVHHLKKYTEEKSNNKYFEILNKI